MAQVSNFAPFRRIAVCLDGSDLGEAVLPHARAVSSAMGAELTLLRVLECETADGSLEDSVDWDMRRREGRAYLEALASKKSEGKVSSELMAGSAAEQICLWADRHDVGLTVLCSHGARGRTDWSLSSTARKLMDRLPGSLLLVPAAAARAGNAMRYRRILVPLDGSSRGETAIPAAVRIARAEDAEIVLVHVVPAPELTRVDPLDADDLDLEQRVVDRNERVAIAYLDRQRARVDQAGSRARAVVVRDGDASSRLPRLIDREGADLVVMSAHGHTNRAESPFGAVASQLIAQATVPVLVIRDRARGRMRRVEPAQPVQRLPNLATL